MKLGLDIQWRNGNKPKLMTTLTDVEKEIPDFLKKIPKIRTWNYKNSWNGPLLRALTVSRFVHIFDIISLFAVELDGP